MQTQVECFLCLIKVNTKLLTYLSAAPKCPLISSVRLSPNTKFYSYNYQLDDELLATPKDNIPSKVITKSP